MATLAGIIAGTTALTFATGFTALLEVASVGSLFLSNDIDIGDSSPTYSFGPISNTKTQMLPIPLVYGGPLLVAGNVCYERFLDADKYNVVRYVGISEGPVEAIYDIYANEYNLDDPFNGTPVIYQKRQIESYTYYDNEGRLRNGTRWIWVTCTKAQYLAITDTAMRRILNASGTTELTMPLTGCSVTAHLNTTPTTTDSRDPGGVRPYPNDFAFVAMTLKAQENLSSNPTITSIVKGIKVWTPTGIQFSNNPVWIIRDFLTNARYGLGIPTVKLDSAQFLAAAAYCDELIDGLPRFTLNYVIDTQKPAIDHLSDMLSCCRGYVLGRDKIGIYIDQPVSTYYKKIGLDNIVEGSFSWWQSADEDILNRVIVEWVDPDDSYETTTTIFEDTVDIEARGAVEKSFSLKGITNRAQAGRMGAYLLDSASGVRNFCSFSLSLKDSDVEAGDVIALTHDLPGWVDKWFRVIAVTDEDSTDDLITVSCSEYAAEIYNDRALDVPERIQTTLSDPFNPPNVTGLSIVEDGYKLRDGTHVGSVIASWTALDNLKYRVYYQYSDSEEWTYWQEIPANTESPNSEITGVRIGKQIRAKVTSVNDVGFASTGSISAFIYLNGIDTAPPDLTRFTAAQSGSHITFSGVTPKNVDYNRIEIRHGGTSWESARSFAVIKAFPSSVEGVWNGTHVFWAKQVDNGGNYSVNASNAVCSVSGMDSYKNIVLTRDDVTEADGTTEGLFLSSEGYYISLSSIRYMDLPATYGELAITNYYTDIDNIEYLSPSIDTHKIGSTGILFDFGWQVAYAESPTYGEIADRAYGDYPNDTYGRVTLEAVESTDIRFSNDAVTWSEWQPYLAGEYEFRYIQFRFNLEHSGKNPQVYITKLAQYYDVPDLTVSDTVSVPIGGATLDFVTNYGKDFYSTPTEVTTTVIGGAGNVFPEITNLSEAGLTLKCYDRTGAEVAGTVQLSVKGY